MRTRSMKNDCTFLAFFLFIIYFDREQFDSGDINKVLERQYTSRPEITLLSPSVGQFFLL